MTSRRWAARASPTPRGPRPRRSSPPPRRRWRRPWPIAAGMRCRWRSCRTRAARTTLPGPSRPRAETRREPAAESRRRHPVCGSAPWAPRCSRFTRAVMAASTMARGCGGRACPRPWQRHTRHAQTRGCTALDCWAPFPPTFSARLTEIPPANHRGRPLAVPARAVPSCSTERRPNSHSPQVEKTI